MSKPATHDWPRTVAGHRQAEDPGVMTADSPTMESSRFAVDAFPRLGAPSPGLEPHGMKFTYASGDKPLSGFTIKRGIGVGGFGEVYFALSDAGKEVALKRVQRNLDIEMRGVSHCLNLKHPHLISLFDVRYDDAGQAWVVMEYVAGASLRAALDAAPQGIGEAETRRWFAALAAGVAHLHDSGIVHRDLKPGNLFDDDGIVKIGDYGLSKFISCSRRGGHTESIGTFHYMAPEVGHGNYGREIDIYAMGIILYEMLTGGVPFDGESSHEIVMKHLTANPDLSAVAEPYRTVIWHALQKNPAARQQTVHQMIRPLGIEIDDHGLPRMLASTAPPAGSTDHRHSRSANAAPDSPGVQFAAVNSRSSGTAWAAARDRHADADMQFGEVRYHGSATPQAALPSGAIVAGANGAALVSREEPLARTLTASLGKVRQWWAGLEPFPGTRIILAVLGVVLLILNIQWVLPLLALLAALYIPYYIIRAMTLSVTRQPSFAEAHQVAVVREQRPRPLSASQWRARRRGDLARKPRMVRAAELSGSLVTAIVAAALLASLAAIIGLWDTPATSTALAPFVWSACVAFLAAVALLACGKLWEPEATGRLSRRLAMLAVGAAVGAAAFLLAEFLMLPLADNLAREIDATDLPRGLYGSSGAPLLPALMVHFAILLGALRWWRSVDPLRRSRLSLWAIAVAVVGEWALHQVLPIPQPWGMLTAGLLAAVAQIAAPWEDPRQRLRDPELTSGNTV